MIMVTASLIVQWTEEDEDHSSAQHLVPLRQALYGPRPDDTDRKIDAAVARLEAACKPVLSAQGPT